MSRIKVWKTATATLYALVVIVMATATIVEKYHGTAVAKTTIYGSWWFVVLWALLVAMAVAYIVGRRMRRASAVCLHSSFAIILLGALLTHLTARQGMVHLRQGTTTNVYYTMNNGGASSMEERPLPFQLRFDRFNITYHEGTAAVKDYTTYFTLFEGKKQAKGIVSMNHIFAHKGIRLYQSSYDEDGCGSILSLNQDPWGIPVTYFGYALLFVSLVWTLLDPRGAYRRLLRSPLLKKGGLTAIVLLSAMPVMATPQTLSKETAEKFGRLNILYGDRICPMQTFAIDFTKKLYGKPSYKGFTAEQVLAGFVFYQKEWSTEPIVRVKGNQLKTQLNLPDYMTVSSFFSRSAGGYLLGPYVEAYYQGNRDKLHSQAADIDDKLQLIMELRRGIPLKVFPFTVKGVTTWYAPTDKLPATMERERKLYIENIFSLLYADLLQGRTTRVNETLDKMLKYQQRYGGRSIPSPLRLKAERLYNQIPFATILFMVNLTLGFVCLFLTIFGRRQTGAWWLMALSFAALTVCLALRWIISGNIPMANGYETVLLMAWLIQLTTLLTAHRFPIMLTFGFLLAGFFLLVSHISQMDPQISHLMPVLASPLLTVHVSFVMVAYALLSLTFICGIMAFLLRRRAEELCLLSQIFLYPALACLGFGIFMGAIWANVSWGNYWSWDPKETWALITFMVYAVAIHPQSLPWFRNPTHYHLYITLAFLTILMTYFGVNYFLGGMHSYA